jgi:hypothetical protein
MIVIAMIVITMIVLASSSLKIQLQQISFIKLS